MLKAVLDTNVLISGLINPKGTPARLVGAWRERKFDLVVSPAILEELAKVLQREKIRRYYEHLDKDLARRFVVGIRRFAILVPGEARVQGVCADMNDDKFIAAALDAGAEYIVSGDDHLLDLKEYHGV